MPGESAVEGWLLACAAAVLFMQAGFLSLESGLVRAKNSISVAVKNVSDLVVSIAGFWMCGFGLMFGTSWGGWVGTDGFALEASEPGLAAQFVFQAAFVGTAATVMTGAVAERTRFFPYLMSSLLVSTIVYPVFGHWAWGGAAGTTAGWLAQLGFVDFAGGAVVHATGGWVALAGVIAVGPRIGRFDGSGAPRALRPSNPGLAVRGALFLFVGWLGFNCGATVGTPVRPGPVALNTLLAGAFGCSAAVTFHAIAARKAPSVESFVQGLLGGLVGITAGCAYLSTRDAAVVGALSGLLALGWSHVMTRWFRLDDVVGAVGVHAVCGAWGTIATGLFMQERWLAGDRAEQVLVQLLGVGVGFAWAFGVGFALFSALRAIGSLRVAAEAERVGLNVAEHGASTSLLDLATSMHRVAETGRFAQTDPVPVEVGTEVGDLAASFNRLLSAVTFAERELERSRDAALASSEAKSRFIANVSHELRTPLNGVLGMLQLIERQVGSAKLRRYAGTALSSGQALLRLLGEILDFSKLEAGRFELRTEPFVVRDLLGSVVALFEGAAIGRGIDLELFVAPEVPDVLVGDEDRLRQVMNNLVGNALKFTPAGSVRVSATGDLEEEGFRLRVAVEDSGVGIPPESLETIFEEFTQVEDAWSRRAGGTGLGLPICRRLLDLMGGRIGVRSVPGQGSTFEIELALTVAVGARPQAGGQQEADRAEDPPARGEELRSAPPGAEDGAWRGPEGLRVLLVDDDAINREVIGAMLEELGIEVHEAESGEEALALVEDLSFHVIFMDCMMPSLDGFETTRRIRGRHGDRVTPIIALTANARPEDRRACLAAGMDEHLAKPVRIDELEAVLSRCLVLDA